MRKLIRIGRLVGAVALLVSVTAVAGSKPLPGNSSAFGQSLAAWENVYQRWAYGETTYPLDANGNVVLGGNTVLMPQPAVPGDGTPGAMDVTLRPGQSFMLPLWNILGTSYSDGTPNDPLLNVSVFQTLDISLKIDGVTVVDPANVMNYFSQLTFEPAVPLPAIWAPYKDLVWLQGIAILHQPMTPGAHVIQLDVKNTEPVVDAKGTSWVFEYHNTWNVTVVT